MPIRFAYTPDRDTLMSSALEAASYRNEDDVVRGRARYCRSCDTNNRMGFLVVSRLTVRRYQPARKIDICESSYGAH